MEKNNPKVLNDFLNYLISVKGYSINTIQSYNSDLILFFRFIQMYMNIPIAIKEFNQFILLQVREADILAFLVNCNYSKDNNPYTRQRKLTAIRSFYRWLLPSFRGGINKKNPADNIKNIKKIVRLPKYLSLEEAKKIQRIYTKENSRYPLRNNLIISLFLSTGIRLSELININIKDINFENSSINIIGKNNKERIVYYNEYCKKQLNLYLRNRNAKSTDPLFISNQNKRINKVTVKDICENAFKLLNLADKNYTPHTLRHTAATIIYSRNADILLLKSFLGHESIKSTEIYTHLCSKQIKEAVERNPLSNFIINKR